MPRPILPPPPDDAAAQEVDMGAYVRVVHEREVTFTCQACHRVVTQLQYPGPCRRYCSWECVAAANSWASLQRMRRMRQRRRAEQETT
jgi:hypothetical protein